MTPIIQSYIRANFQENMTHYYPATYEGKCTRWEISNNSNTAAGCKFF